MDLRGRISRWNFRSQARHTFIARFEIQQAVGRILLWNLDWNSRAKSRYKILIRISRRHFKTKFRDLNLDQGKIPRFKIPRRLMSCFVAPLLHLRAENLRDAGDLLARNVKFRRFDLYAVERAKRGFG